MAEAASTPRLLPLNLRAVSPSHSSIDFTTSATGKKAVYVGEGGKEVCMWGRGARKCVCG